MRKELSQMTLEELWELFPITLAAHDDRWKDCFDEFRKALAGLLSDQPVDRISHIGSTAIQGIWARNMAMVDETCWNPMQVPLMSVALLPS